MLEANPIVRLACRAFLIAIPLFALTIVAGVFTYWGLGLNRLGDNFIILHEAKPVPDRQLYGFSAAVVPASMSLAALWHLFLMFRQHGKGQLMALKTIHHLRSFAKFAAWTAMTAFLLSGVLRWAMGVFDNAPLWSHLGLSLSHIIVLFASAIIYIATYLIEEGYRYGQEIQEYV